MQDQTYRLLGDQPFVEAEDPFGFTAVARELKSLILRSRDATPFTIGIEASWGRGKSSLMGQLMRELGGADDVEQEADDGALVQIKKVSFNAWTAEGTDVLEGLIKSVLDAMDPSVLRRSLRNQRLMTGLSQLSIAISGLIGFGGLADAVWERLAVDARRRNQINELVKKAMTDWRDRALKKTGSASKDRLLVVSIDDLDRCSPENVLKVFEAVKVYLDAPGFVFIVGYDRDVISDAIQERKTYSNEVTGLAYIEKIVQTVFRIPLPNDEQVTDLLDGFLAASGTSDIFDDADRQLLIDRNSRNPRRMKRFINRFILDYRLDDTAQEFDPELLIKLLIFETYFPSYARLFYDFGEKNPVQEFLEFSETRALLQRGEADNADVVDTLAFYNVGGGGSPQELLQRLEQAVPEVFVTLITDRAFLSLVTTFSSSEAQEELMQKVQRRRELDVQTEAAENVDPASSRLPDAPWSALRILWIDDHPENNDLLVRRLRGRGAVVNQVPSGYEALQSMSVPPTLIISDLGRGADPEAGFADIQRIRSETEFEGPIFFFTGRVSTSQRTRASELGAIIVDSAPALLRLLAASASALPVAQSASASQAPS